jgi:hypothetical protein
MLQYIMGIVKTCFMNEIQLLSNESLVHVLSRVTFKCNILHLFYVTMFKFDPNIDNYCMAKRLCVCVCVCINIDSVTHACFVFLCLQSESAHQVQLKL